MNPSQILWIAIPAASCLLYALLFYLRRSEFGKVRRWFSAFLLAAAFWGFGSMLLHANPGFVDPVWLARLMVFGNFALPLTIFGFAVHFLSLRRWQDLIPVSLALYVLVGVLNLAGFVVADTQVNQGLVNNTYGWGIYVVSAYWSLNYYPAAYLLWRGLRRSENKAFRNRLKYLLIVIGLLLLGNICNLTPLAAYPVDHMLAAIAAVLISLSISRYQLLEIRRAIQRLAVLGSVVLVFVVTITGAFYTLGHLQGRALLGGSFLTALIITLIPMSYPPVRRELSGVVERVFLPEQYDVQGLIYSVSQLGNRLRLPEQLGTEVLRELRDALRIEGAGLLLRQQSNPSYRPVAALNLGEQVQDATFRADSPLVHELSEQPHAIHVNRLRELPRMQALWIEEWETLELLQAEVLVPISADSELIGLFALGPKTDGTPYTREELRQTLPTLANQISIALANSRLYAQEQARADALARANEELRQTEKALAHERDLLHALMSNTPDWIFFKDTESRFTRINQAHAEFLGVSDPEQATGKTDFDFFPPEDAQRFYEEEQEIICTGKPVVARVGPTPTQDGEILWRSETKVPLRDNAGQVIGLIGISRDVTAIKHAEEEVRRRAQEAETLRQAGAVVAATLQQDEAIERILEQLERVVPYDSASVQLLDNGHLEIVGGRGWANPADVVGMRFPVPGDNPNTLVIQRREPLILADAPATHKPFQQEPHSHIESWLGVPISFHGDVIGMLAVDSAHPNKFTDDHAQLAAAFADHVAIALENIRLFETERRRSQELEALREASLRLTSTLELQPVLEAILDTVLRLVASDNAHIFTYDGEELTFGTALWAGSHQTEPYAEPRPGGLTYAVAETGERIVVPDVDEHPLFQDWQWGGAIAALPLRVGDQVRGVMNIAFEQPHAFDEDELRVLEALADHAAIAIRNAQLHAEMQELAITDSVTGLYNRRGFFEVAQREAERARRFSRPLAAIMIDLDRFKRVNDEFGHAAGDQVLKELADYWVESLRDVDVLGRYGGEEFVALLPETGSSDAREVAERLRQDVAEMNVETEEGSVNVTISLGVAVLDGKRDDLETLIERADEALYAAKQAGRNRVSTWKQQKSLTTEER